MKVIVGGDEGEWPKGTKARKINSEPGDAHQDGALCTIVGAMGPVPDEHRAELILDLQKRGITEEILFFYFVEWDDTPGLPVGITENRLEIIRPRDKMKCMICDKGTVVETEEKNHKTEVLGQEITIPEAVVGRCDTCHQINYAFRKEVFQGDKDAEN